MAEAIAQPKVEVAGRNPIGWRSNVRPDHCQRTQPAGQLGDPIRHGEMDCLFNAGRQKSYRDTIIYSTLMPCFMCAGTIIQFKIPVVVVGRRTFPGAELMREYGVEVIDLDDERCIQMMTDFIAANPELWNEDIGE
jgi:cytosine deaminase